MSIKKFINGNNEYDTSFIENLYVREVGLFKELDIQFNKKFNFLIGPNSSGKTSILRCIGLAFNPRKANVSRYGKNSEFWVDFKHKNTSYRVGVGKGWVTNYNIYRKATLSKHVIPQQTGGRKVLTSRDFDRNNYDLSFCPLIIGAYRKFEYKQVQGMKRELPPIEARKFYRNIGIDNLEGVNLPDVKQYLINRYFIVEKEWGSEERANWNWLKQKFKIIAPKNLELDFVDIKSDMEATFYINNLLCYLEELSSGFQAFLSLIITIFNWIESINEGESRIVKNAVGTVLIDELDIHMHPEWQFSLRSILEEIFPNLQFIVTTHSPHLIRTANPGEIIILPELSRKVHARPTEKSYSGWKTDQILEELMGVSSFQNTEYNELIRLALNAIEDQNITRLEEIIISLKRIIHPSDIIVSELEIKLASLKLTEER